MRDTLKIGRRRAMSTIGAIVASSGNVIGSARGLTTIKLVTHMAGNRVVRTEEVPLQWWEQMQKTTSVRQSLADQYLDHEAVSSVSIGVSEEILAGYHPGVVFLSIDKEETIPFSVPYTIDGIEIRTEKEETPSKFNPQIGIQSCNTGPENPVPGGIQLDGIGTSTMRVKDSNYDEYLLTCAHAWDCGNIEGSVVEQAGQRVGTVMYADAALDMAVIQIDSQSDVSGFEGEIKGETGTVEGRVTKQGVQTLMGSGKQISKMGVATCETTGTIQRMNRSGWNTCQGQTDEYIKVNNNQTNGDSGGPVYDKIYDDNFNRWVISIISHISMATNDGTSAYSIHNHQCRYSPGHPRYYPGNLMYL